MLLGSLTSPMSTDQVERWNDEKYAGVNTVVLRVGSVPTAPVVSATSTVTTGAARAKANPIIIIIFGKYFFVVQ